MRASGQRSEQKTVTESKNLKTGTRVFWRGDAADRGIVTETNWASVTIAWDNGHVASVYHGDMCEIEQAPTALRCRCSHDTTNATASGEAASPAR